MKMTNVSGGKKELKKHKEKTPRDSLASEHGGDHATHTHKGAPKCVIVNRMRKNAANTYRQKKIHTWTNENTYR